ncbi:FtsX-like permease family protein, partial [Bacillus toyonensis]
MSFRQLAWNNVIRNKRLYLGYFLSSIFTVMIFFTFELLAFHPQFSGKLGATSESMIGLGTQGFKIAQYLIIFFSFFFILYSVGTFLKTRKREFGILTLHGMTNFQLKQLIFIENMLIGSSSIIVGIGIGLIFGKLILLVSASIFVLKGGLPFYFPTKAIFVTSISFLLLFLLVSFFTTRIIKLTQVIELMKSEEKPKPEPRVSKWLAIFAILFISIGYAAAFYLDTALKTGNHY